MATSKYKRALDCYFASISRVVPVTETYEDTETDFYGHRIKRERPVFNSLGKPVERVDWLTPPTVSGLCLHLGVDKETFLGGLRDPERAELTLRALLRIENALNVRMIEEPKTARGVIRDLAHNFGWMDHREIDFSAAARDALTGAAMTMAEKRALLVEAAGQMTEARGQRTDVDAGDGGKTPAAEAAPSFAKEGRGLDAGTAAGASPRPTGRGDAGEDGGDGGDG